MKRDKVHISICICTYKRPQSLKRLLEELGRQDTQGHFSYSIVVADNHHLQSAKRLVSECSAASSVPISYCVEPVQNIALARNRAVAQANGDYVAFIDDDEFPARDWLINLFRTCRDYEVDGVLGPVKPLFEHEPPNWVVKGGFFERPTHDTGFVIDWTEGRTGNLLLKREILIGTDQAFKPEYGSGGEDRDFFKRMIGRGHVFMWCDQAVVYETVPPTRWRRSFMLRRALLRGKMSLVDPTSRLLKIAKSTVAIPAYMLALPFLLVSGQHKFMRYLIKTFDHLGRVLAFLGIHPVKENYVTE